MARTIKVKDEKTVQVAADSLRAMADNIATISDLGRAIKNSGLNRRAIVLLLEDMTKVSMNNINKVLDALPELEKTYLK